MVHEDVLAVLPSDEAITLSVVEPLHCAFFHCRSSCFSGATPSGATSCQNAGNKQLSPQRTSQL
jgi:hypothetical protein